MDDVVYWVADDPRNAAPRDHRATVRPGMRPVTATSATVLQPAAAAPVYASPPVQSYGYGGPSYGTVYPAAPQYGVPQVPPWGMPPYGYPQGSYWGGGRGGWGSPGALGGIFGNLNIGTLIDAGTQIVAAFMSLPTPPAPTTDGSTDVANLVTYQSALASHAKRDEQIRTVGSLAGKLLT